VAGSTPVEADTVRDGSVRGEFIIESDETRFAPDYSLSFIESAAEEGDTDIHKSSGAAGLRIREAGSVSQSD
jgi:hypothetical protein